MKDRRLRSSVFLALPLALGFAASGQARDLVIVGPGGGYQDAARTTLFKSFQEASGVKVTDDASDGELAKIYSMVDTGDITEDIEMIGEPELLRGCEDGLFEPVDYDVVKKDKFIEGTALKCGVGGAGWGAAVFYDKTKHAQGPETFADFFDVEKFPGKRSLRSTAQMTLEAALLADGVPRDQVYEVLGTEEGVARAFARLDTLRGHVVWWTTGAQPLQFVGSGEVDYALAFTGRIQRAMNEDKKDYQLDWDTLIYSVDYWAVVAGSPMKDEAMKMLDWITDAGPLREQAKIWPISPANKEINEDPEIRKANPGMVLNHTDEGLRINTEFWVTHGEDLEARFSAWAAR
ncbi:MAG: extracellular solute-binding protein [Paracoccus sp. (in: a-proteobacteria)]|uniref:extracellular solute-binding protein n=1 Tax=Paracoccus sp. TaxID=267 RepID=UPI0039E526F1